MPQFQERKEKVTKKTELKGTSVGSNIKTKAQIELWSGCWKNLLTYEVTWTITTCKKGTKSNCKNSTTEQTVFPFSLNFSYAKFRLPTFKVVTLLCSSLYTTFCLLIRSLSVIKSSHYTTDWRQVGHTLHKLSPLETPKQYVWSPESGKTKTKASASLRHCLNSPCAWCPLQLICIFLYAFANLSMLCPFSYTFKNLIRHTRTVVQLNNSSHTHTHK